MFKLLPTDATAPFCPSEVGATVVVPRDASLLRKAWAFAGGGLLVAVGYMDPGNWATDVEAGSRFGYGLLGVVLASSLVAMLLQALCVRVGLASGRDLAQLCGARYGKAPRLTLWLLAELAIVACDLAEVLGTALALKLLFHVGLVTGILLTALDTVVVLVLQQRGFRGLEAIVFGLVATITACFAIELALAHPPWSAVFHGFVPEAGTFSHREALVVGVGILGATVMPHNLYLHTSIVQTRAVSASSDARREAINLCTLDTVVSLALAFAVNAAILVLAGTAFHLTEHTNVVGIEDAHRLLEPILGTGAAAVLFAVALFASGQSSTFTGTIAGQVIMEGFLNLKIPCYQRRLITRVLAIVPALIGVLAMGPGGLSRMLVLSQVVLSLQLPFAVVPLLRLAGDGAVMHAFVTPRWLLGAGWLCCGAILLANGWLVLDLLR
jgi:manganese transport protein